VVTIQECKGWQLTLGGEGWGDLQGGTHRGLLGYKEYDGYRGVHLPFLFKLYASLMHCSKWMTHVPLTQTHKDRVGYHRGNMPLPTAYLHSTLHCHCSPLTPCHVHSDYGNVSWENTGIPLDGPLQRGTLRASGQH